MDIEKLIEKSKAVAEQRQLLSGLEVDLKNFVEASISIGRSANRYHTEPAADPDSEKPKNGHALKPKLLSFLKSAGGAASMGEIVARLGGDNHSAAAIRSALARMAKSGEIKRAGRGKCRLSRIGK